jgi:hypothetical protein
VQTEGNTLPDLNAAPAAASTEGDVSINCLLAQKAHGVDVGRRPLVDTPTVDEVVAKDLHTDVQVFRLVPQQ